MYSLYRFVCLFEIQMHLPKVMILLKSELNESLVSRSLARHNQNFLPYTKLNVTASLEHCEVDSDRMTELRGD